MSPPTPSLPLPGLPVPSRQPRRLEKPPWNWICNWETRMRWGNSRTTHWEGPWKQTGKLRPTVHSGSKQCYSLSLLVGAGLSTCSLLANPTEINCGAPEFSRHPGSLSLVHTRGGELTWSEFQHVSSSWSNRCFFPNCRVLRFRTELTLEAPESGRGEGLDPAPRARPPPSAPPCHRLHKPRALSKESCTPS